MAKSDKRRVRVRGRDVIDGGAIDLDAEVVRLADARG